MESSSGIILVVCALIALVIANSSISENYFRLLHSKIFFLSTEEWINEGLMVIFFFVIGMEIKREIIVGELNEIKKSSLPIIAALGGMIAPALIYFFTNSNPAALRGWAIPTATDIAFALAVLTLFGQRVPLSLKIFLMTLAIVDDLGAVTIIAVFYTNEIRLSGLALAGIGVFGIFLFRWQKVKALSIYTLLGIAVWLGILCSGIHATIAGVLLGLATPHSFPVARASFEIYSPIDNLARRLHPWVNFGIMPIFAFANAGIPLTGINALLFIKNPISMGIIAGLVIGKPLGISLASFLAVQLGMAKLPAGTDWKTLISVSCLAGIGFTMSLFITPLALPAGDMGTAKIAIVLGSVLSTLVGSILLKFSFRGNKSHEQNLVT